MENQIYRSAINPKAHNPKSWKWSLTSVEINSYLNDLFVNSQRGEESSNSDFPHEIQIKIHFVSPNGLLNP